MELTETIQPTNGEQNLSALPSDPIGNLVEAIAEQANQAVAGAIKALRDAVEIETGVIEGLARRAGENAKRHLIDGIGTNVTLVMANLDLLPQQWRNKVDEINSRKGLIREAKDSLRLAEMPYRMQAQTEKNAELRKAKFEELTAAAPELKEAQDYIAKAELQLDGLEADKEMLNSMDKNNRQKARMVCALLTGESGQNGD